MTTFAIGDIHGQVAALKTVFNEWAFGPDDTLVFLGDYVDRGPDVRGVIEFLITHPLKDQFVFLKGNHELMMIAARQGGLPLKQWVMNGGAETLDAYGIGDDPKWYQQIPASHWAFLESGLPYYESGSTVFVHAGLEPGVPPEQQDLHHLYWKKYLTPEAYDRNKTVVCGHTSRKNGLIADFGHTICIDTYAYGGQWLTCLDVDHLNYLQTRENGEVRKGKLSPG